MPRHVPTPSDLCERHGDGPVFVALGGSSYAAVTLSKNSVGASQIKAGAVRSSEVKDGALAAADLSSAARAALTGQRGATGPAGANGLNGAPGAPGAKGDKGDTGAAGADATKLWAVIDATDGTPEIVRSRGTTAIADIAPGAYSVTFDRDITGCAWIATAGSDDAAGYPARFATVEQNTGSDPTSVRVKTFNDAGTLDDEDVHLAVFC